MLDGIGFGGALIAGVLSFFSPCVLPIVPGYLAYLAGLQDGRSADGQVAAGGEASSAAMLRLRRIITSVFFVAGFVSVFMLLGLGAALIAPYLKIFQQIAGVLIILLGVHFLGLLRLGFLDTEARFAPNFRKGGMVTAFIVGLAFGFGWTPCVGPVLATIFLVISTSTEGGIGVGLLLAYGLGIGIPFIVVAAFTDLFLRHFSSMRRAVPVAKIILGSLMVATGALMVTGKLNAIGFWLLRNVDIFGTVG